MHDRLSGQIEESHDWNEMQHDRLSAGIHAEFNLFCDLISGSLERPGGMASPDAKAFICVPL